MFSPKQQKKQEKAQERPKEFHLNDAQVSELSFVVNNYRTFSEVVAFWDERKVVLVKEIEKTMGIDPNHFDVDWGKVFSTGKIFAYKRPQPAQPQAEAVADAKPEDAKPELQEEQGKGVPSSK